MPGIGQRKIEGHRFSDTISFAVISRFIPCDKIQRILNHSNKSTKRNRLLPAHIMIYYIIALGFYFESSSRDVLRFLLGSLRDLLPDGSAISTACKSAISQARTRIGKEPVIALYDEIVQPLATEKTEGAFYKKKLLVVIDGSKIDVADTEENTNYFGKQKYGGFGGVKGEGAFPLMRFLSLMEVGTHVIFETVYSKFSTGELTLGKMILEKIKPNMLVLADRLFFTYETWKIGIERGADLLWRIKKNTKLKIIENLPDGSSLAKIYPSERDRKNDSNGIKVRLIEYQIKGKNEIYRLITTMLDHNEAPAEELAALYSERWTIETVYDELKNHTREKRVLLKSKTPELVIQEFYGLLLAHYAIRGVMHEAALQEELPPDRLSFVHSVRVVRRKLKAFSGFSPSGG
jgi:Transposase DDE domain/Insertion element 4 transposase N-terminal